MKMARTGKLSALCAHLLAVRMGEAMGQVTETIIDDIEMANWIESTL